jgi:nondiscriminating glutamyl-tRNA synthetase
MNSQYIKNAPVEVITDLAIPHLRNAGYIGENLSPEQYEWIKKIVNSLREGMPYVAQIAGKVDIFFNDEIVPENEETLEILKGEQVPKLLDVFAQKVKEAEAIDEEFGRGIFKIIQKETGIKGKNLFMPIRIMITGQMHGPEIYEIIPILGRDSILKRLERVKNNYL